MLLSPIDDPLPRQHFPSSVTYSRFRSILFNDLLDANPASRARALENIVQIVSEWARVVTDSNALVDLASANLTPPFSPANFPASSIEGTLFAAAGQDGAQSSLYSSLPFEKLSISTQHPPCASAGTDDECTSPQQHAPRSRTLSSSMSSSSPVVASPTATGPCHSASSSTSTSTMATAPGTAAAGLFSSSPLTSSSYHFQNDPDVHFNRSLPDSLSPLEERVAEVDEAARLLRHHILTILRFSICCPYKDVKICLHGLLKQLEALNIPIPQPIHPSASFFIDPKDIFLLDSPDASRCASPTLSRSPSSSSLAGLVTATPTPTPTLPPAEGCAPDETTKELMTQTFLSHGRVSNLSRILAYFPSFWERFEGAQTCMMNGPGPIPKPWRCYVAIMAASQYNCQYMVSMMKLDYLNSGGDPTWLNGLQYTTQKIRNLAKLNGLMAHQPWLLKPRHINELVSRDSNHNPHNVWTISELAQVMVILSTIHSISIFVAACGIVPEIDMVGGTFVDFTKLQSKQYGGSASIAASMMSPFSMLPSPNSDADATEVPQSSPSLGSSPDLTKPDCDFACDSLRSPFLYSVTLPPLHASKRTYDETTSKAHTAELIRRLLLERDVCVADGDDFDVDHTAEDDPCGLGLPHGYEEIQDTFPAPEPRIISPSLSTSLSDAIAAATQEQQRTQEKKFRPVQEDMGRFLDMSCQIEPALFDCRSIQYSVFRVDEFRWEDDGAALLSKCLPELSESLQDEFAETLNFTDLSLFDENEDQHEGGVDTFAFRQAIWYYTLRLFGLVYQDYNYKNMSKFLNMTMAVYVRKACHCITMASEPPQPSLDGNDGSGPQLYLSDINKIDRNDFENMGFELRQEERCHINVIVMEACKQAKLLYALRAVDRWERRAAGEIEEDEGEDERF